MTTPKKGDSLLTAQVAGCSASAATAFLTFPLDFLKVNQQLSNYRALAKHNVNQSLSSISHIMTGSSALVLGAILKNFARVSSYNWASNFMAIENLGDNRKTSAPRVVIAGAMSGFIETLFIVPFERIKITMIQNSLLVAEKKGNPLPALDITGSRLDNTAKSLIFEKQYLSPHAYFTSEVVHQLKTGKIYSKFSHHSIHQHHAKKISKRDALKVQYNANPAMTLLKTVKQMFELEGIHAFTAGTMITFARQIGTSAAWFSTYSATRQFIDPHGSMKEPSWFSLSIGGTQQAFLYIISAVAAVAVTQPLDVVKSHIQLKNGRLLYHDSLSTAYRLVARKGFMLLYAGAFPRGFVIATHGCITALLYNYFEKTINLLDNKSVFTDS